MFGTTKGQGATEYLVLLAVVLVIALVSIALLGVFPSFSSDTKVQQSKAYWQAAAPVAIIDSSMAAAGTLTAVIRNTGTDALTLTATTAQATTGGNATAGTLPANPIIGPGSTATVTYAMASCTPGSLYQYNMVFTYNTANIQTGVTQTGATPLSLKCQ